MTTPSLAALHPVIPFGYWGRPVEELQALVAQTGALVVDIRMTPESWDRRWQGLTLRNTLGHDNYRWLGELGNRNYKTGGPIELAAPEVGAQKLAPILARRPAILLCQCADPVTCHRTVVAAYLAAHLGVTVQPEPDRSAWIAAQATAAGQVLAISLWQPWASLCVHPDPQWRKRRETRHWATAYRGPLAIHATKKFDQEQRGECLRKPFSDALYYMGYRTIGDIPLGAVLGVVDLVDCVRITPATVPAEPERSFGDYTSGRYAWVLELRSTFEPPIPARGYQQLWRWAIPVGVPL